MVLFAVFNGIFFSIYLFVIRRIKKKKEQKFKTYLNFYQLLVFHNIGKLRAEGIALLQIIIGIT